ncbi:MAG TPA: cobalamin-dependent protein, partial [Tissierellaceae bacterium]|nr:cobalamin-dependent protein [Tissierellaceae bacterium]
MRILLVRPPRIKQAITLGSFMFSEPLGLEMIYGVLKKDHQVKILDMMIQDDLPGELKEFSPHIVGITSLCIDVDRVISLAGECKAFDGDIITMVGGTQTLLSPESFFDEGIDHIFRFSTRDNILELMGQIEDGRIEALDG